MEDPRGTCVSVPDNPKYTSANLQTSPTHCENLGLAEFKPTYYPLSQFLVAVKPKAVEDKTLPYLVDTTLVVGPDGIYQTKDNVITTKDMPDFKTLGGADLPSDGATAWEYMNRTLKSAYWVGMGPLQLTGDSMTKFFGWYYQNLADDKKDHTFEDYQQFVDQFLQNGVMGFEGALWYWNFRINKAGGKPIHCMLGKNPSDVCHDIGIATYMTNGGCENAYGRDAYYNYFKSTVFGLSPEPVIVASPPLNGNQCSEALYNYCDASLPKSCN